MTRLNLVPPSELMDQHLFAEFREIKMVPKSLARSLRARGLEGVLKIIPPVYTLNTGHVSFFYDKWTYLIERYSQLCTELRRRGVAFDEDALLDPDYVYEVLGDRFKKMYLPTPEALALVRERIAEKIAMKPNWYRK